MATRVPERVFAQPRMTHEIPAHPREDDLAEAIDRAGCIYAPLAGDEGRYVVIDVASVDGMDGWMVTIQRDGITHHRVEQIVTETNHIYEAIADALAVAGAPGPEGFGFWSEDGDEDGDEDGRFLRGEMIEELAMLLDRASEDLSTAQDLARELGILSTADDLCSMNERFAVALDEVDKLMVLVPEGGKGNGNPVSYL